VGLAEDLNRQEELNSVATTVGGVRRDSHVSRSEVRLETLAVQRSRECYPELKTSRRNQVMKPVATPDGMITNSVSVRPFVFTRYSIELMSIQLSVLSSANLEIELA
jgi:hypothetical protein